MFCDWKVFRWILIVFLFSCERGVSGQTSGFDLPLSFDAPLLKLSEHENLFINKEYVTLIRRGFPSRGGSEAQYLYIRSLYYLQDWKTLTEVTKNYPPSSFLYAYVKLYQIQAHVKRKEYDAALELYLEHQNRLKEIPYPEEISDLYEEIRAGLKIEDKSLPSGRYYYFCYELFKNEEDLKTSLRLLDSKALALLNSSNVKKLIDSENYTKTARALMQRKGSQSLSADLFLLAGEKDEAGRAYFLMKNYSAALAFLNAGSLEAALSRIALEKGQGADFDLALKNPEASFEILMKTYLDQKQYGRMAELLRRSYRPGWLREMVVGMASEGNYQELKPLLISLAGADLSDTELAMIFYYLGHLFALENRPGESLSFFREAAVRFPADFYGAQAFQALSPQEQNRVLKDQKKIYESARKTLEKDLKILNQAQFPDSAKKALFFLKVGEYEKGYRELRAAVGDLKPYSLALLKFYKSLNRISLKVHFAHQIYQELGSQTRTRLFYPNLFAELFPLKYHEIIDEAGKYYEVPALLLAALIRQESRFDEKARSWVGAQGLMQLMPRTAAPILKTLKKKGKITHKNIYDPQVNILTGTAYFQWLYYRVYAAYEAPFREILSIASYNAGPGRIKRHFDSFAEKEQVALFIESIPLSETREYVKRVLLYRDFYLKLYPFLG